MRTRKRGSGCKGRSTPSSDRSAALSSRPRSCKPTARRSPHFQLAVLSAQTEAIASASDKFRHLDRARRLCHSLKQFFYRGLGTDAIFGWGWRDLKRGGDPRYLAQRAIEEVKA